MRGEKMGILAKGNEITKRRIERGWDKSTLAKRANLNHSLIVRVEKAKTVSPASAKAIADALDSSVFELFELSGSNVVHSKAGVPI
jgi:transcriptional regulator with XRE-family HTH domain